MKSEERIRLRILFWSTNPLIDRPEYVSALEWVLDDPQWRRLRGLTSTLSPDTDEEVR